MREVVEERIRELAKRAGWGEVSPRVVLVAAAVVAVAVLIGVWRWGPSRVAVSEATSPVVLPGRAEPQTSTAGGAPAADASSPLLWVHVVGAVRHPGLYGVGPDSRVENAVEAAGGLVGDAAPEAVNLARKVADGEQIVIPTQDEAKRGGGPPPAAGGTGATPGAASPGPIDLNSASAEQLDTLPGVGPATATKIVADREANGPYGSVEDLGRVSGIGPKKLEELKDLVSVR